MHCLVEARQSAHTSWPAKEHEHIGWPVSTLEAPEQPQDILFLAGFIIGWDIKEMGHKSIGNQALLALVLVE